MLYIKMTDSFFSGWGLAEGKKSIFCVRCNGSAEASQVMKAARRRPEMSDIRQQLQAPKNTDAAIVSIVDFKDLTGMWLK